MTSFEHEQKPRTEARAWCCSKSQWRIQTSENGITQLLLSAMMLNYATTLVPDEVKLCYDFSPRRRDTNNDSSL